VRLEDGTILSSANVVLATSPTAAAEIAGSTALSAWAAHRGAVRPGGFVKWTAVT
jgi:hypothetical protein